MANWGFKSPEVERMQLELKYRTMFGKQCSGLQGATCTVYSVLYDWPTETIDKELKQFP